MWRAWSSAPGMRGSQIAYAKLTRWSTLVARGRRRGSWLSPAFRRFLNSASVIFSFVNASISNSAMRSSLSSSFATLLSSLSSSFRYAAIEFIFKSRYAAIDIVFKSRYAAIDSGVKSCYAAIEFVFKSLYAARVCGNGITIAAYEFAQFRKLRIYETGKRKIHQDERYADSRKQLQPADDAAFIGLFLSQQSLSIAATFGSGLGASKVLRKPMLLHHVVDSRRSVEGFRTRSFLLRAGLFQGLSFDFTHQYLNLAKRSQIQSYAELVASQNMIESGNTGIPAEGNIH